uniref:Transcription repressor n=1 Tax=Davidia involucrata TaxID=16924 RepID=A0A5B7CAK6_DAVIN
MPSTLGRNLHLCFTKITGTASAESSLTPPTPEDHSRPLPNSTNTTTSILIKNFNSLYDHTFDSTSNSKFLSHSSSDDLSSSESDTETTTPDFATVFASQRFFFSSPGRSNSIIESSSSSPSPSPSQGKLLESDAVVDGGIAIPTYSPDPYKDFRRSMQEMVEARDLIDVRANWDYLHELLLCYLALNPKSTHKFIVGAFADLLVSLMT